MTKADIVNEISEKTGVEKIAVQATVEAFMKTIRNSMIEGKNVYLRGFGTFVVKKRAEKIGRNISKNTTVVIPAHYIPAFKPAAPQTLDGTAFGNSRRTAIAGRP